MTEQVSDKVPEAPKRASEMSPFERAQALAAIIRGQPLEPLRLPEKMAKDLTPAERAARLNECKRREADLLEFERGARTFNPMPTDRNAKDMSEAERKEWLREHQRKFR